MDGKRTIIFYSLKIMIYFYLNKNYLNFFLLLFKQPQEKCLQGESINVFYYLMRLTSEQRYTDHTDLCIKMSKGGILSFMQERVFNEYQFKSVLLLYMTR